MIIELHAKSDVGRVRRGNEDNYLILDLSSGKHWTGSDGEEPPEELRRLNLGNKGVVLIVSDGMGGALAGDVASRMAVEPVRDMLADADDDGDEEDESTLVESLKNATDYANFAIHKRSQDEIGRASCRERV